VRSHCSQMKHLLFLFSILVTIAGFLASTQGDEAVTLSVDASPALTKNISSVMYGVFFEEINHAGTGGLWAELVSNRGFEAGRDTLPPTIEPWKIIGNKPSLNVSTDSSSCFAKNKVALKVEVLCSEKTCPSGGVGVYNPGFWGM
ncbi:hypothetical protein M569_02026, partial [Genlisea aurea]